MNDDNSGYYENKIRLLSWASLAEIKYLISDLASLFLHRSLSDYICKLKATTPSLQPLLFLGNGSVRFFVHE